MLAFEDVEDQVGFDVCRCCCHSRRLLVQLIEPVVGVSVGCALIGHGEAEAVRADAGLNDANLTVGPLLRHHVNCVLAWSHRVHIVGQSLQVGLARPVAKHAALGVEVFR